LHKAKHFGNLAKRKNDKPNKNKNSTFTDAIDGQNTNNYV